VAVPNSPSRAELAEKFATFKPTEIIASDPDQVFEVPMPASKRPYKDRQELFELVTGGGSGVSYVTAPPSGSSAFDEAMAGLSRLPALPEPPKKEPGIFGVPILGDVLDLLDTPRAAIVSGIQEIGDVFGSGDASLSEWWDQTSRNMSAGEVLNNWGVELPGPLDFAVGLGLDIALDPLTYLAGAGLALRAIKGAPEVATALKAASRADDVSPALRASLEAAEEAVSTRGVLAAAGRHPDAFRHIGINPTLGFSVPGTGVLGRRIIERPLASLSANFAEFVARRRVQNTPQLLVDTVRRGKSGFDITNPNNQQLVIDRMLGRGGASAQRQVVGDVAAAIGRSPVKVDLPGALGTRGAQAVGLAAGAVGGRWNSLMRQGFAQNIAGKFNTQASINNMLRSPSAETRELARNVRHYGQLANVTAGRWEKQTLDELQQLVQAANRLGLDADDLDELMFRVATTPAESFANAGLGRYRAVTDGGEEGFAELAEQARAWWQSAGRRASESTQSINLNWHESLYAARMRDDLRAGKRSYNANEGLNIGSADLLSGTPATARRLLEPRIIRQRILDARRNRSVRTPFRNEADRLDQQARLIDSGDAAEIEAEFLRLLDAELAEGVRYVDGDAVMTNQYLDGVIEDVVSGNKSVLDQMDDIDAASGLAAETKKGKRVSFSSSAKDVLPRYVALMKAQIRSANVTDRAMADGIMVYGSKLDQGVASRQVQRAADGLDRSQSRIDTATEDLKNMLIDEDDVAHILEVMLHERRIGPDELAAFLKTPEGELYGTIAELQAHADVIEEVLTAAVDGKLFSELSDDARLLLLGGDDVEDWAGLSQTKRDQIARNRANRDEALLAVQEATDYIYMLTQALGDLETRRNALGGILKQMKNQRPEMPATTSQRLDKLARDLDESRQMITDLVENIKKAYSTTDATVIAGLGLKQLGEPAAVAAARAELRATARQMGKTAEGLRDLRQMMSFIPEDGQFVRFVRNGRTRSWEIRVRTQPLKNRPRSPRKDSLAKILGEERAEGLRKIAATMDDSPEALAQIKVLENYINITMLQERLGVLVPGSDVLAAVDSALGNAVAIREVVANHAHNQYWDALTGALDGAIRAGRSSAAMRPILDRLAARAAEIDAVIDNAVTRLDEIGRKVRDSNARRAEFQAELTIASAETQRLAQSAWLPDQLKAADSAEDAAKLIAKAQNANVVGDLMDQSLADFVMSRMRSFNAEVFPDDMMAPRVGSLTRTKLRGASFVAPLDAKLTDDQITQLAREFAEMYQAVARTNDPAQMSEFFLKMQSFNNWWKAQAVGTPGFIFRNMMGAFWMNNQLAGVPMHMHGRVRAIRNKAAAEAKAAGREGDIAYGLRVLVDRGENLKIRGGPHTGSSTVPLSELRTFQDWYGTGMASGTGGRGIDIVSSADSSGMVIEGRGFRTGLGAGTWKPTADFKFFSGIRGANADAEFMARGALAHDVMMRGGSVEDASDLITKYHFDYSDLTAAERAAKQVIPFWTWQRRVLPVLVESIGRNPKAWNRISQFQANIERQSPQEGMVPDYYGENMGIRMPFKIGGFRTYLLPDLPFVDLAEWAKGLDTTDEDFGYESVLRKPFEAVIPSYKMPVEILMGVRSFNQVPLTDELEFAPSWAKVPIIREALLAADRVGLPGAKVSRSGELLMSGSDAYQLEQLIPIFARLSRLAPNIDPRWESSDTAKMYTSFFSTFGGLGFRANTPKEKRNEMLRRQIQLSEQQERQRMLGR